MEVRGEGMSCGEWGRGKGSGPAREGVLWGSGAGEGVRSYGTRRWGGKEGMGMGSPRAGGRASGRHTSGKWARSLDTAALKVSAGDGPGRRRRRRRSPHFCQSFPGSVRMRRRATRGNLSRTLILRQRRHPGKPFVRSLVAGAAEGRSRPTH